MRGQQADHETTFYGFEADCGGKELIAWGSDDDHFDENLLVDAKREFASFENSFLEALLTEMLSEVKAGVGQYSFIHDYHFCSEKNRECEEECFSLFWRQPTI